MYGESNDTMTFDPRSLKGQSQGHSDLEALYRKLADVGHMYTIKHQ